MKRINWGVVVAVAMIACLCGILDLFRPDRGGGGPAVGVALAQGPGFGVDAPTSAEFAAVRTIATNAQAIAITGNATATNALAIATLGNATATNALALVATWDGGTNGLNAATARTSLAIANVEDTALSTWAGTANITTVGTVATGTWNATAIALANGGTGATDAAGARTALELGTAAQSAATDFATAAQGATADAAIPKAAFTGNLTFLSGTGVGTYATRNASDFRTDLGLGTAATNAATAFATAAQGVAATNALALATTANGTATTANNTAEANEDLLDGTSPLDTTTVIDRSTMTLAGWGIAAVNQAYYKSGDWTYTGVTDADITITATGDGTAWYIIDDGTELYEAHGGPWAHPDLVGGWNDYNDEHPEWLPTGTVAPSTRTIVAVADKADAAIPAVTSATENNLAAFDGAGLVKDSGVAATTFARAPADVATNAAKLALTGITAGHIVRVTGEANRLEMYTGGAINSDANWQIIGPNTYKLYAFFSGAPTDPWTLNGVQITSTDNSAPTLVGWVREGEKVTIAGQVTKNLDLAYVQFVDGELLYGHTPDTAPLIMESGYSWLYVPYRIPDRASANGGLVIGLTEHVDE